MKKAARPNGPTKKKDPLVQNRKADEIYLRLQKSAPFPTRKKFYVLCVSSLPNAVWSNRAYTDKQILLWSEITPFYFKKKQPKSDQNFHPERACPHRIHRGIVLRVAHLATPAAEAFGSARISLIAPAAKSGDAADIFRNSLLFILAFPQTAESSCGQSDHRP